MPSTATITDATARPVLALDPSIVKTGWAYYDATGELKRSGVLRPKGPSLPARLLDLQMHALALVGREVLAPDVVVLIEQPPPIAYHKRSRRGKALNVRAQHVLCMAVGALAAAFAGAQREVILVDVLLWKGRQAKAVAQVAAQAVLGRRATTDESDAIAIGRWWAGAAALARAQVDARAAVEHARRVVAARHRRRRR